ncbi:MAG: sialate O-acetylesterase [Bacteroidales bacterium 36-12]|jgi:sialate O-acetylesterase|nr:MAG: sialate O-acetylesterase [Bacteroidales bacterium 36-12]
MKKPIILFLFLLSLSFIRAEISLPSFFSSDMVLQQQSTIKIWGKAEPNKNVTAITSWNLKKYKATADNDGKWSMSITTGKAGGPYSIILSDGKAVTLSNILLGEVWLCSGQSNMEMPMRGFNGQPVEGGNLDILKSTNSKLRLFRVERKAELEQQTDVTGRWEEAMPVSVRNFSATAYYFGRLLQETLNVPVGLISSSWGGSTIEAWMDAEMLKEFPTATIPTSKENIKYQHQAPTMLYNGMIYPLIGYGIKGVIWYQGESNKDNYQDYAGMFKSMTDGWRKVWGLEDQNFPFYFCQIAPFEYNGGKNSAFLREAQTIAAKEDNTGIAILMDTGEKECIHPANKRAAGERLALNAITKTYNITGIEGESPEYKDININGNTVTVNFAKAPNGLYIKGGESQNFTLAGEDKIFYPAKAKFVRNKLEVTSESVPNPVAVRYAFENFVIGDLFGMGDLPVSSFRSDDWDD